MPASPQDLFARLNELGIDAVTYEHPPLHTVEDSKALRGDLPGGHHKNLFLRDKKKRTFLVVTQEDKEINLKQLRHVIGANHPSFGSADRLMEFLGVEPGSVTPFALINDDEVRVHVTIDADILEADPLNFHPLVNTMTTAIAPDDLLLFIRACGHDPLITPL
jgi:Ala-tRNA(Pro) deacylase